MRINTAPKINMSQPMVIILGFSVFSCNIDIPIVNNAVPIMLLTAPFFLSLFRFLTLSFKTAFSGDSFSTTFSAYSRFRLSSRQEADINCVACLSQSDFLLPNH